MCEKCGKCCREFSITLTDEDLEREPKLHGVKRHISTIRNKKMVAYMLQKSRVWVIDKVGRGCPCVFLDENNLCRIYETRPGDCRDYPKKGVVCLQLKK